MSPHAPRFAPALVERESRVGGGFVLRSPTPLRDVPRCVGDVLVRWAKEAPSRVFLAERRTSGKWRTVTYAGALAAVRLLAKALLDRGNFFMVLWHGGTLYIDEGKPAPGAFEHTVKNLRELSPTAYFNVPRGFDMLVGHLEEDAGLAASFFRDLDIVFYAAAALSQPTWERLEAVSTKVRGSKVAMVSAWGSTETSPLITQVHFPIDRAGVIGLPAPGCELAFVPSGTSGGKLEMRVRGPNVSPGYWRAGGTTEPSPRDEHGFYPMGDAGRLADEADPAKGVVFDGRTAENFKLSSGTWVHVGELRIAIVGACAPLVQDAVLTGHDREEIGLLAFPSADGLRHPDLDAALRERIASFNAGRPGTSNRIAHVMILQEPPSIDAGEITDKGYINQRAVLDRRAALVEALHGDNGDAIRTS